jgi:hypothetical protein
MALLHPLPIIPSLFTTAVAVIENYTLLAQPGQGVFEVVFNGMLPNDDKIYAVKKTIPRTKADLPRTVASFFRVVFTQLFANHPAIVPLFGWNLLPRPSEAGDRVRFWLVTEKISKGEVKILPSPCNGTEKMIIV